MATTNDPRLPERDPAVTPAATPASWSEGGRGSQIMAMFDTFERARAARDRLVEEGIPSSDMDIVNRDAETGYSNFDYERNDQGFWGAIKRFFVPDEDAYGYAEGLRRGHALLVVQPPAERHDRIVAILEEYDPIDFEAQEEEWRQSGWAGGAPLMTTSAAAGTGTTDLNAGARSRAEPMAPPTTGATGREEAIPVVEEDIRVGKRVVDRGGVRVRSYVVERPVEENVTLRDETVSVERRPTDRPAGTLPEDAFRERTIEVSATGEAAVVQKDARVTEEVVVRKDEQERTETVRDTARKTEVEVEDTRTGNKVRPSGR
jgi:uncharacterized protein (TIGR02271 family)